MKTQYALVQTCAEARVAHWCRATGRQETEHMLGQVVDQYRRLISTCAVRAAALCTLAMRLDREMQQQQQGSVDGRPPGTRLGQEGELPWPLNRLEI